MTVTKPPVPVEDNLAQDLMDILIQATYLRQNQITSIMTELVPYIVERDHKILTHGYETGRASV